MSVYTNATCDHQTDHKGSTQAKDDLELEKLHYEIMELRQSPVRARRSDRLAVLNLIATTLTTIAVATLGGIITGYTFYAGERQHQEDQEALVGQNSNDVFEKLVVDLGSSNAAARAGAVVGLERFAKRRNASKKTMSEDRSRQTITILTMQLLKEQDQTVIRVLVPTLVELGPAVLEDMLTANRDARSLITDILKNTTKEEMPAAGSYNTLPDAKRAFTLLQDQYSIFDHHLAYLENTIDFGLLSDSERAALLQAVNHHLTGVEYNESWNSPAAASGNLLYTMIFGETGTDQLIHDLRYDSFTDKPERKDASATSDNSASRLQVAQSQFRTLYITGLVLSRILRTTPVLGLHLGAVGLLGVDLSDAKLDGADFSNAFISGAAIHTSFRGANFFQANLANLEVSNAVLDYTNQLYTRLPWEIQGSFVGSNWWNSWDVRAHDPSTGDLVPHLGLFHFENGKLVGMRVMGRCLPTESAKWLSRSDQRQIFPDLSQKGEVVVVSYCGLTDTDQSPQVTAWWLNKTFPRATEEGLSRKWWSTHRIHDSLQDYSRNP
jgi:hypothetical protein